ncbi:MAG: SdpI family protein [Gemmatimonadota bacterium]
MAKRWLGIIFVAAATLFSLAVYGQLPDPVATHFAADGTPDGWSSRALAAFGIPLLALVMIGLFHVLPRILPRRAHFQQFEDTYWAFASLIIAFLCALHVVVIGMALGWPIDMPAAVLLGVGSLFVILGTLMPRVKSNWLLGIRTPWTMENERVWHETHRLAGRTMPVGGLVTIAAAFLPPRLQPWVAMGALAFGAFVPVVYSYIVWRREQQISPN